MVNFEFQRNLPFQEFAENGSWLQGRNPTAYLFGFLLFFTSVLITQSWIVIVTATCLCIAGIFLSGISFRTYLSGLLKAIPWIGILALINILLNPLADTSLVILKVWIVRVSVQDLRQASLMVCRFIIFMQAVSMTTASLSASRFIHGLEDLLKPLSMLGVRVHDFVVSVEIAIRYIPLLTLTAERIAKAQASRGATWGTSKGHVIQKAKQIIPVIVPLFIQSYHKAEKIAVAMDARGYGLDIKRSQYYTSRVRKADWMFVLVNAGLLILAILVY